MTRCRTRRWGHNRSGYTVVELMMAIAIMAIGLSGIIAMQKVTVASNMNAKNVSIATHIGQSILDELAAETRKWTQADNFANTVWLQNVGAQGSAPVWFSPQYSEERLLGQGYDALGNAVADEDLAEDAHFCAHVRLTWLSSQTAGKLGGGLIRAEVRVYWRREGIAYTSENLPMNPCVTPVAFAEWAGAPLYHVVSLSTALRQSAGGA